MFKHAYHNVLRVFRRERKDEEVVLGGVVKKGSSIEYSTCCSWVLVSSISHTLPLINPLSGMSSGSNTCHHSNHTGS